MVLRKLRMMRIAWNARVAEMARMPRIARKTGNA